jgi:hypothetical protein
MKRSGIIAVLCCLALGAVRAEAQTRVADLSLFVEFSSLIVGEQRPTALLSSGVVPGTQVYFVAGYLGLSEATVGGQTFVLPFETPALVGACTITGSTWSGGVAVPNVPRKRGQSLYITAVAVAPNGQRLFSQVMPWGPIIEDSIQ